MLSYPTVHGMTAMQVRIAPVEPIEPMFPTVVLCIYNACLDLRSTRVLVFGKEESSLVLGGLVVFYAVPPLANHVLL